MLLKVCLGKLFTFSYQLLADTSFNQQRFSHIILLKVSSCFHSYVSSLILIILQHQWFSLLQYTC